MLDVSDQSTLLIIPCCAAKVAGGQLIEVDDDPLQAMVSSTAYGDVLHARENVLGAIRGAPKYVSDKYAKNIAIVDGPGLRVAGSALLMRALDRYGGSLYRTKGLKENIRQAVLGGDRPRVLILSALYGPLHPLSPIQDYNLMMSDAPAKAWTTAFPRFLADYVERNGIRRVALYVGSSTAYFKIARKAVVPLLANDRIERAVQYHVVDGGTRETPTRHGALLAAHLSCAECAPFFEGGMTQEVRL
jgi:hypothetical protein